MARVLGEDNGRLSRSRKRKPSHFGSLKRWYGRLASIREGLAAADEVVSPEARRKAFQGALAMYMTKGSSW